MTLQVFLTLAAQREMIEARDWYETRARGLGDAFRNEADAQVERMTAAPLHFPEVFMDVRRARLRRFPYGLFFRQRPRGLFIIACFHSNRDPAVLHARR